MVENDMIGSVLPDCDSLRERGVVEFYLAGFLHSLYILRVYELRLTKLGAAFF